MSLSGDIKAASTNFGGGLGILLDVENGSMGDGNLTTGNVTATGEGIQLSNNGVGDTVVVTGGAVASAGTGFFDEAISVTGSRAGDIALTTNGGSPRGARASSSPTGAATTQVASAPARSLSQPTRPSLPPAPRSM